MFKRLLIINLIFILLLTGFVSTSSAKNLYRNKAYNFSITFPEGWKVEKGSNPNTAVIASDITGSRITIEMVENDTNHTADTLTKEIIAEFLNGYKTIVTDMVILDQSETRIGKRKALMAEFNGTIKNIKTSSRTAMLTYFTIYNDYGVIITCATDLLLYKNYKKTFIDSVSTLVFENDIIDRSPVGTTKESPVNYEDLEHFVNSIKKIHPNYQKIVNNPKFKEYINSLPDKEIKAVHKISRTEAERIYESGTAEEIIQLISNYKINKAHPDYPEIINNQIFKDYVNNLPWQQIKPATRTLESGTAEEIIQLISNYKFQKDYQESHKSMIKRMIENYSALDRSRAINILQDWINKVEGNANVISLSINDSNYYHNEKSYLVIYTIARGSNKQKYIYKFNFYADVCQKVVD